MGKEKLWDKAVRRSGASYGIYLWREKGKLALYGGNI